MALVLTFSLFTIIPNVKNEQSLLIAQAPTSLTVLSLLGTPIVMFVQIVPLIVATIASFSRIQDFLISASVTHQRSRQSELTPAQAISSRTKESKYPGIYMTELQSDVVILSVKNGTFGWKSEIPVL
jgi:ATP-binding cassette subfamily C (CFTR/MRP) protein 1